jgi:hypothetical protein
MPECCLYKIGHFSLRLMANSDPACGVTDCTLSWRNRCSWAVPRRPPPQANRSAENPGSSLAGVLFAASNAAAQCLSSLGVE